MPENTVELTRATPESTGISSKDILNFVESIEGADLELHSLMILKDRQVVAEGWWKPYRKDDVHLLYSLSKSFTSTAIGFAVQEGLLTIDDLVVTHFADDLPANVSDNLKAMKVRHLLSMATGHSSDTFGMMHSQEDGDWAKGFLKCEVTHEPGTHFLYNSGATYMLSAIISRVTGMCTLDYLRPRLLDPLGIEQATWTKCPKGVSVGASEMSVTTESIARFGQFYLDGGVWNGERLLDAAWIADATQSHVSNGSNPDSDWEQGYGFQFWRCRHNCYRGDGAFGQYCIVMPGSQMVVAMTSSLSNMQAVMDLVWTHLLTPAQPSAISEDSQSVDALRAKLASLKLAGIPKRPIPSIIPHISGRMYKPTGGDSGFLSCIIDFDPNGATFTVRTESGDRSIRAGANQWINGVTSIEGGPGKRIAATGGWVSDDTYEFKVRYTLSPSGLTITCKFDGDSVQVEFTRTSRFMPPEGPVFEGRTTSVVRAA